jgi:hypothetical protein
MVCICVGTSLPEACLSVHGVANHAHDALCATAAALAQLAHDTVGLRAPRTARRTRAPHTRPGLPVL